MEPTGSGGPDTASKGDKDRAVLSRLRGGDQGLTFKCVLPKPSSKSVPAWVGSSVLPTLTSHWPGNAGPLDCLLGSRWQPYGVGQLAGMENSLGPSLWPPGLGFLRA